MPSASKGEKYSKKYSHVVLMANSVVSQLTSPQGEVCSGVHTAVCQAALQFEWSQLRLFHTHPLPARCPFPVTVISRGVCADWPKGTQMLSCAM